MKRDDRLFALMQRLKDGGIHTAEAMAQDLNVSIRTIYRDMERLAASGVPVEGARGTGYSARATVTLPPLNLTTQELEALHLGLAVVGQLGMDEMSHAAAALSRRIEDVLPEEPTAAPHRFGFATEMFAEAAHGFRFMPTVRSAIRARQKLRVNLDGNPKPVVLWPLHLDYWGRIWTCVAWDETAASFSEIRMDRINDLSPLPGLFVEEPGKGLADYRAQKQEERASSSRSLVTE